MNRPTSRSPAQAVIKATDAQPTLVITNQARALPTRPSAGISSIVTIGIPQNRAPVILYRGTSNSRAKGKKCSPTIMRSSGAMSAQRWVITHARVTPVKARPSAATIAPNRRQSRRPSNGRGCVASRTWNTARSIAMLMTINATATTDIVTSSAVATGDRTTSNETAANAVLLATSQRLPPAKPRLRRRPIKIQPSSCRRCRTRCGYLNTIQSKARGGAGPLRWSGNCSAGDDSCLVAKCLPTFQPAAKP